MARKKKATYNPNDLIKTINKWPIPIIDKKHNLCIYVEGRARSNQTRIDHIVDYGHDLKVRDLEMVPEGIKNYFVYKKDPIYKDTYNYYFLRKGLDKGFVKISIQIDSKEKRRAWIKTIYITYKIK